ncbi:carbohydrate kinase [Citrobacter freundii]|nr:carbohydrate kinase [Citrobacter freundii]MDN4291518.1 carbohydrate kinase [Citrobacter freundii]
MYHVDNSTGVPVMPLPSPITSETELFFTEGGNGVPPTYPGPDWFNAIQSELLNIIRAAGLDPDKMDNTQILAALKKLFLSRSNPFGDIKTDGAAAIATALSNLGLGDGSYVGRLIALPKVFKSSGTYTPTQGTKYAIAEVQGAGGGGGNATGGTTTSAFGTSGGAGAYALSFFAITSGTASIVVGAGGVPSGNGGTSSFSGFNNTIIAAGGNGGTSNLGSGSASSSVHARGADGGNSSGGTLVNAKGAAGTPSFILSGTPSGGTGGDSHFSGGALGAGAQGGAGQNAILGAGGSGATVFMANATYNGGSGGDGIVIIWEYA